MKTNSPILILLETSAECCSAAISRGEEILASRKSETSRQHASMLAPFVRDTLADCGLSVRDCDAVAVSGGPGSYTGLRVGVSTAKGLCFGAGIPLISVDTLEILAWQGYGRAERIVPMLDARRMEVYCAVFDSQCHKLSPTEARILDENSFCDLLAEGTVLFIGDGAEKFSKVCSSPSATFDGSGPVATAMARAATKAWQEKRFEDIAYFEPFYLMEFVAGKSKKSLL